MGQGSGVRGLMRGGEHGDCAVFPLHSGARDILVYAGPPLLRDRDRDFEENFLRLLGTHRQELTAHASQRYTRLHEDKMRPWLFRELQQLGLLRAKSIASGGVLRRMQRAYI